MNYNELVEHLSSISGGYESFVKNVGEFVGDKDKEDFYPQNIYKSHDEIKLELFFATEENIMLFRVNDVTDGGLDIKTRRNKDIVRMELNEKEKGSLIRLEVSYRDGGEIKLNNEGHDEKTAEDLKEKIKGFYKKLL